MRGVKTNERMKEKLNELLKALSFEPSLIDEISTVGRLKEIKAEQVLISPGKIKAIGSQVGMPGMEMPIVISGLLKVMREDDLGHEIFLYFLEGGETCAMSIVCCMEKKPSLFRVIAEEDSQLWMIPISLLDSWVTKYPTFRKFVFNSYQNRFDELLHTVDSVVFTKLDERLYKYLLDVQQATGSFEIFKTHSQIAKELNTSRVVVSRLLKQMEKEEKIEQYRNRIEIL